MAALPPPAAIEISIAGIRNAAGHVRLEVCRADTFLKSCPWSGEVQARAGTVTVVVPDVPPGTYAVQAVHDENDNKKVDRNMFGIPKEGVGFSRDARVCMGPPRFADAAFDHGAARQAISLTIRYRLC